MSESTPTPLPPAPGWERIAAGVLVVLVWEKAFFIARTFPRPLTSYLWDLFRCVPRFRTVGDGNLHTAIDSGLFLGSVKDSLWAGLMVCSFLLLPLALARALSGRGRFISPILWWAAFAHGAMAIATIMVDSRYGTLVKNGPTLWYQGWLTWPYEGLFAPLPLILLPHLTEFFLAALVLWCTRRRKANGWWSPLNDDSRVLGRSNS